ncbi:MAG: hypothetical protein A3K19_19865 [Lentisphaerae bacterium RIFOXYB12_FULL_65_16]|nr:MAG: hypothetical protein A3K18_18960 [Lentisphaerae bacterium RIFOXYA12_64_32]OGV85111.1 MAG: hypothetical protein A3K19_19865 [Lentisphaerae bacterium RIFOXYB12_FULL_65_16]
MSTEATPTADGSPGVSDTRNFRKRFVPEDYTPRRKPGIEVLDRGANEVGKRYVLKDSNSGAFIALAEEDLNLWNMFDGKRSAQDVLQEYVQNFKTLPVDRLVTLIRDLWKRKLLLDDPGLGEGEGGKPAARLLDRLHAIRIPVPGLDVLPDALWKVGLGRLLGVPLFALFSVLIVFCVLIAYLKIEDVRNSLALAVEVLGSSAGSTLVKVVVFALVLNLAVSGVRELLRAVLVTKGDVDVDEGGVLLRWFVPLVYFDAPMLLAEPRRKRLNALVIGVWFDLLLASLAAVAWGFTGTKTGFLLERKVWLVIGLLPLVRLILSSCPFLCNDLYVAIRDLLDEPRLRRRTLGFVKRNFGRTFGEYRVREYLPYICFALLCVFWIECVLSISHSLTMGARHGEVGTPVIFGAMAVAIPVVLIAGSIVVWGARILAEGFRRDIAEEKSASSGLMAELAGLGAVFLFTFFLPAMAKKVFCLSIVFISVLGILYLAWKVIGATLGTRPGYRLLALALFAQILWIPLACIFAHIVTLSFISVPWTAYQAFAILAGVFFVLSLIGGDFLKRGPTLGLAEGFVWIGVGLLLYCTADVIRLGRSWEDYASHSFTLSFLVLGAGFLFFGFSMVHSFLKRAQVTAQPFPFLAAEQNQERLDRAFSFFVTTLFDTVLTSFGTGAVAVLKATCNADARRSGGADIFADSSARVERLNLKSTEYGAFLQRLRGLLENLCGHRYVDGVFDRALTCVHWDCRVLLMPLLQPEGAKGIPPAGTDQRLNVLRGVHLLRNVPAKDLLALASCTEVARFEVGQPVVLQGTPCDAMTVVVEGVAHSEEWDLTGEMVIGAYVRKADFFGESALLPSDHGTHPFCIRAAQPVTVCRIKSVDFDQFCRSFTQTGEEVRRNVASMQRLRKTPLFNELSPSLASFLLARIRYEKHAAGTTIIRQGDIGNCFYIINRGKTDVFIEKDGKAEKVAELKEGSYFGEIALIMDAPRNATVRAVDELEVGVISKEDFLSLRRGSKQFQMGVDTEAKRRDLETVAKRT